MKALKTILALAIIAIIVITVLSFVMPKVAFNQKKALWDSYKIAQTQVDTDESYIIRVDLGKGTWDALEIELENDGWKASDPAEYWTKSPNKDMFTDKEIKGFVKEYCRMSKKKLPIQEKYFTEFMAIMYDEQGYHIYYELQMKDSEVTPCH